MTSTEGQAASTRSAAWFAERRTQLIVAVFFASGFAGLVYEVMFAKSLALVFGSTATAATTVLATYMGGMSLGSWLGGKLAARTGAPLKVYALCEAGIAAFCGISPMMFGALRAAYVALARGAEPGQPSLVALQVALGAGLLLPPTLLMGATLPLLAKHLEAETSGLGKTVGVLYGANTLGAATGALATGYVLLRVLGVVHTTLVAVELNLLVALAALYLAQRPQSASASTVESLSTVPVGKAAFVGWIVLGVGGLVTLALESIYTHLLAVVAGNSTFAFSAMLTCFLVGLGLGSIVGRRWMKSNRSESLGVGLAQAFVAVSVFAGVFVWDHIPRLFQALGEHGVAKGFWEREMVRLSVCAVTMVPPALFIGASYPLAMECIGRAATAGDRVRALGRAAAVNTLGNVVGALVGGFALLPHLGSLHSLQVLGATSLGLALVPLAAHETAPRRLLVAAAGLGALFAAVQPRSFDLTALSSGANVYFQAEHWGDVIDYAESADGGFTSVAVSKNRRGETVKTLLTNAKFQGNDERGGEVRAQVAFAIVPLLHLEKRDDALVIGFGTGTTSRVVSDAGFSRVDIAELSSDIVHLADRHFSSANLHVIERPSVHLHLTDGRNFLMVEPRKYDLITLEISSIWFAGAASLYNADFYRLAKARLKPGGVLQQWLQPHHLGEDDYVAILSSIRSSFRYVWLYIISNQGVLTACNEDCAPTEATLRRVEEDPKLQDAIQILANGVRPLLATRVLTPDSFDAFLAHEGVTPDTLEDFESTDDNLMLEYSTPQGNVRDREASLRATMWLFGPFRPPSPFAGTHLVPEGGG